MKTVIVLSQKDIENLLTNNLANSNNFYMFQNPVARQQMDYGIGGTYTQPRMKTEYVFHITDSGELEVMMSNELIEEVVQAHPVEPGAADACVSNSVPL